MSSSLPISASDSLIRMVRWNPQGTTLAVGYRSGRVEVRDANGQQVVSVFENPSGFNNVVWDHNGYEIYATPYGGHIRRWDVRTQTQVATYASPGVDVALHPTRPELTVLTLWGVEVFNTTTHALVRRQPVGGTLTWAGWSPDGSMLGITGYDGLTLIMTSELTLHRVLNDEINDFVVVNGEWSPDGTLLASAGWSDDDVFSIRVWNAQTGALVYTLSGHTSGINSLRWHADGIRLASGSQDGTIRIWDMRSGQLMQTIETNGIINSIDWRPDSDELVYGGEGENAVARFVTV